MKLARSYTLWFSGLVPNDEENEDRRHKHIMTPIANLDTVDDFWGVYQYLVKPDDTDSKTCYHLFQKGIKPVWEDESNKAGGRWHIWVPKGQTNKLWEDLLLYIIGNQCTNGDQICGIEVRTKLRGDSLSIWHMDESDKEEKENAKKDFIKAIGAEDVNLKIEYHKFTESIEFEKRNKNKKHHDFARKDGKGSFKHE